MVENGMRCRCNSRLVRREKRRSSGGGPAFVLVAGLKKKVHTAAVCNGQQLASVPSDLPTNIQEFILNDNIIKNLRNHSFLQYTSLRRLSLGRNNLEIIESGAFLNTKNLEDLNLEDNAIHRNSSITAVALQAVAALRRLELSGNRLNEDMVATLVYNLSTLASLHLSRNSIMRIDSSTFEGLSQLRELTLDRNYIYEIESGAFDSLKGLQNLNLAHNYIGCIVDFSLTQLKTLNISYNIMEWFLAADTDEDFELEILDLSNNKLLFFPLLPKRNKVKALLLAENEISFYEALPNSSSSEGNTVQFLHIKGNVTNTISVNLWEEASLGNHTSLDVLDLSRNQLRYLPQGFLKTMVSLSSLNLSQNCLETIHIMSGEPPDSLVKLDLSQNNLVELQVNDSTKSLLPNLKYCNLSNNRLSNVFNPTFSQMQSIITLDLSHNQISFCSNRHASCFSNAACIDFSNIRSLQHLHVTGSQLERLCDRAFHGTPITHLDLSDNSRLLWRTSMLVDLARTLQWLSLRNTTLISNTSELDFSMLQKLRTLDLSHNLLARLPPSLGALPLQILDLRSNKLSFLQQHVVQKLSQSLHTVFLSLNPYNCCRLSWWDILYQNKAVKIADESEVKCNLFSYVLEPVRLSDFVLTDCKWTTENNTLFYFLLALPTCVSALGAIILVFFSFKQQIFKFVKQGYRKSSPY
ncbi:transforming growth factor beta activator LRRC33 [Latimeria chalumnae]|uniref:transforming growth factor beta activator LRRC33 n=1 Tax=Latimeria chalumnae TaxID=7897 RepID=UPI00313E2AB0